MTPFICPPSNYPINKLYDEFTLKNVNRICYRSLLGSENIQKYSNNPHILSNFIIFLFFEVES